MRGTTLHWVNGPWQGRLALTARPRGGDWLEDEMKAWRQEGTDTVVSFLEEEEERELDLTSERREAQGQGMRFESLPIVDRTVPKLEGSFSQLLDRLSAELSSGKNVVLHCRQGIGRTGLVAACLLLLQGYAPAVAMEQLSAARGVEVPETPEQRLWVEGFAEAFAAAR